VDRIHLDLDRINPGSVILSGVMMLEYKGWQKADAVIHHFGNEGAWGQGGG